jgi:hypothetical protein
MNFTDITVLHSLAGVLLRMLQGDPDLSSITHVFVDEVHERSVDSDIVRFFFFARASLSELALKLMCSPYLVTQSSLSFVCCGFECTYCTRNSQSQLALIALHFEFTCLDFALDASVAHMIHFCLTFTCFRRSPFFVTCCRADQTSSWC